MVSSEVPAGRSHPYDADGRPGYGPRPPRPSAAGQPGRCTQLVMGLVPGVRALVSGQVRIGAPYIIVGLGALLGTVLLFRTYPTTLETLRHLRIQPRFIILHAAGILALVTAYELLRFGASLEEHPGSASGAPRFLAALWLPALVVVTGGPTVVAHAPRIVEPAWFAATVVVLGAAPAVVRCALGARLSRPERPRTFRWGSAAALFAALLVLVSAVLGFGGEWSAKAEEAGFRLLPGLIDGVLDDPLGITSGAKLFG